MEKAYLHLQKTETAVVRAAANIYAAYITAGHVPVGDEKRWMERATDEAIFIATLVDDRVVCENEVKS